MRHGRAAVGYGRHPGGPLESSFKGAMGAGGRGEHAGAVGFTGGTRRRRISRLPRRRLPPSPVSSRCPAGPARQSPSRRREPGLGCAVSWAVGSLRAGPVLRKGIVFIYSLLLEI